MDKPQILRGVDSEISSLSEKDREKFWDAYQIVISDSPWLSQRGVTDQTDQRVIKKILYNEMFNGDYTFIHRDLMRN